MKMVKKQDNTFMEERRKLILAELNKAGKVRVSELCKEFSVTKMTIRNDLLELGNMHKLKRVHGGAISTEKASDEETTAQRKTKNHTAKKKIAVKATKFINEGDTLILDTGTSIFEFAKALIRFKSLTAITIDLNIASYLERNTDFDVIVVGGFLRKGFSCTLGPKALEFMDALNADKAVLSSNSFNLQNGFMTPNVSHVEIKKEMIKKSNERIMLMDSSKVNTISLYTFAELKDIDVLITDSKIDGKIIKKIKRANKNLEVEVVR